MERMTELELAWLAGLYEGEGTLVQQGSGWALSITMCDEDVVRRAYELTKLGTVTFIPKPNGWASQWRWRISNRGSVLAVASALRPHLGHRRGQRVDEFLEWARERQVAPDWDYEARLHGRGDAATCANGHPREIPGRCRTCERERQRRRRARLAAGA